MAEATRDRIVRVALQLFRDKGYQSTSIADIRATAEVNSGSLYHAFPSKQDLLLAVLDTYLAGIDRMLLEPAWRGTIEPIAKIFALLARYRQHLVDTDFLYGCPIGNLALEIHEPDPPVRERLAANFSAWTAAVERCLAEATLQPRVDRRAVAALVLAVMEGAVMLARTHRDIAHFDRAVGELRRYVATLTRTPRKRT